MSPILFLPLPNQVHALTVLLKGISHVAQGTADYFAHPPSHRLFPVIFRPSLFECRSILCCRRIRAEGLTSLPSHHSPLAVTMRKLPKWLVFFSCGTVMHLLFPPGR